MVFEIGVKNIQAAAYNGAGAVVHLYGESDILVYLTKFRRIRSLKLHNTVKISSWLTGFHKFLAFFSNYGLAIHSTLANGRARASTFSS